MKDKTISILIPAYNEEKSIKKCVESCLNQTRKADEIIVVNDGSTDKTLEILKSFKDRIKVINLTKNTGNKSKVEEIGLTHVKTDIFITTDGDTRLDENFVKEIIKGFDKKTSAVCGLIKSEKNNWITKVRQINYIIGQTIYKKAQSIIGALFVLPGPSSAFKTKEFKKVVKFDHDNVTEDLDFTYKLKLANKKIVFNEKAIVYTQDPNNLKSYFKQLYRWHSGGWFCLKKNRKILKKPNNLLILSLLYIEGLIVGGLSLALPILILLGFIDLKSFLYALAIYLIIFTATITYGIFKFKEYNLYLYLPHYYILTFFEQIIFIYTFIKEFILNKKNMTWQRADRY